MKTQWRRGEKSVGKWYRWTKVSADGPLALSTLYLTSTGRLLQYWKEELHLCKEGQTDETAERYASANGFGPRVAPSCTVQQYLIDHPQLDPGFRPRSPAKFPRHPF